jgi:hypothetical protein
MDIYPPPKKKHHQNTVFCITALYLVTFDVLMATSMKMAVVRQIMTDVSDELTVSHIRFRNTDNEGRKLFRIFSQYLTRLDGAISHKTTYI